MGYLIAMALECMLLLNPLRYMAIMMTVAFAIYVFAIEFVDEILDDIRSINKCARVKRSQQQQKQKKKHMHDLLFNCIETHSDVKKFCNI